MQEQEQVHGSSDGVVLVARTAAWGLPTACPACLPSYLYLKLANVAFSLQEHSLLPDSDDLPYIEFGDMVGFASESGGTIGFLKRSRIVDLDAEFSEAEAAQLQACSALVTSWLWEALLYELWENENQKVVNQIYFSSLPWPINKILNWKQQWVVNQMLGINPASSQEKAAELYRKAAEAYEALSTVLGEHKFFMKTRPSSLDAFFLGHALFILQAPLENSHLKEELLKHTNLVNYAESLRAEFFEGRGAFPSPRPVYSKFRPTASSATDTPQASARSSSTKKTETKERSEKDKLFRRRAKFFLGAQLAATVVYLIFAGIAYDEVVLDEDEGGDDD